MRSAADNAHQRSAPPKVVGIVAVALQASGLKGARILDPGAGTGGKFTETLARQLEGFDVVVVEPYHAIRESLCKIELLRVEVPQGRPLRKKF